EVSPPFARCGPAMTVPALGPTGRLKAQFPAQPTGQIANFLPRQRVPGPVSVVQHGGFRPSSRPAEGIDQLLHVIRRGTRSDGQKKNKEKKSSADKPLPIHRRFIPSPCFHHPFSATGKDGI